MLQIISCRKKSVNSVHLEQKNSRCYGDNTLSLLVALNFANRRIASASFNSSHCKSFFVSGHKVTGFVELREEKKRILIMRKSLHISQLDDDASCCTSMMLHHQMGLNITACSKLSFQKQIIFLYLASLETLATNLFEWQLGEPSILQHLLALGGRGVTDLQEQVVGVEATVLTDALLRLQHPRAHVHLAGAQLELLLTPMGGETLINLLWSLHNFPFPFS